MEWRENLEVAKTGKNIKALESLLTKMRAEAKILQLSLGDFLDTKKDYNAATEATRKLIFIDKVCADINKAIEQIEN
jgi:molecular chaperone HscB